MTMARGEKVYSTVCMQLVAVVVQAWTVNKYRTSSGQSGVARCRESIIFNMFTPVGPSSQTLTSQQCSGANSQISLE